MKQTLSEAPVPFKGAEIYTLPNGFRIILKEDHTVQVVAIQAWTQCGAVNEQPKIYGISHGLEHMVFKGTPTRSAGEITRAIESHGGAINAATQLETTHYYIDIPSYGVESAVEVLSDTILHPTFPQEELERERLVILEEIYRRNDSPDATLWDEFISNVFKNTAYEIKVIGSVETVSALSREDLNSYFRSYYVPSNKLIVLAGDFDSRKMEEKITKLFGDEKAAVAPKSPVVDLGHVKPTHARIKRPVQQSYIALGRSVVGLGHADAIALDVLSDIIGGGASSRLYQSLREQKQVALSLSCDYIPFKQMGLLAFFMETLPELADKALVALKNEVKAVLDQPIRQAELDRARARIKSEWLHGSEAPHGQASTLGSLAVLGKIDLVSSYLPTVDQLTTERLAQVARTYLNLDDFFVTQVDPL